MEKEKLLDYLHSVMALELDIQIIGDAIELLDRSRPVAERKQVLMPYTDIKKEKDTAYSTGFGLGCVIGVIIGITGCSRSVNEVETLIGTLIGTPIYSIILGCIMGSTFKAFTKSVQKRRGRAAEREHKLATKAADKEFQKDKEIARRANDYITQKELSLQDTMRGSQMALERLYDVGIVQLRYRNLVAVSTFCDYLESGRCDALEGPFGAYNLYENELRAGLIIGNWGRIKEVVWAVDTGRYLTIYMGDRDEMRSDRRRIRENQALLSRSLEQSRQVTEKMTNSILELSKDTNSIRESAAMTSCQTEATARVAKAMKKIAEYDFNRRWYGSNITF